MEICDTWYHNALAFVTIASLSMSLGLQGIMGKRVNTQFTTTSALYLGHPRTIADPSSSHAHNDMVQAHDRAVAVQAWLPPRAQPQDHGDHHALRWRLHRAGFDRPAGECGDAGGRRERADADCAELVLRSVCIDLSIKSMAGSMH